MMRKIKGMAFTLILAVAMLVPAAAYAEVIQVPGEPQLYHVTDAADVLTSSEEQALEEQAWAIEDEYGFGVYIVTLYDYRDYSEASVFDAAVSIYQQYTLGAGEGDDGLLLLLSMDVRDYSLIVHGDYGNYAFNDEGRALMTDFFLDDFANDYWYAGFAEFLTWSETYLDAAAAGNPYSDANIPMSKDDAASAAGMYLLAVIIIPFIVMFVVIRIMDAKMKSVATATEASHYVSGALQLSHKYDTYSHTDRTSVRIQNDDDDNGPRTSHSGGFSGTSGKF